jgi:hypothetical protein
MSTLDTPIVVGEQTTRNPYIQWTAVFAGAITAAAISSVLLAFASAAGFSLASTAPTWRDSSFALWLLAGLLLILVALLSFGAGGYVAGRLRARAVVTTVDELAFRDGMHGILSWGIAILFGGLIAVLAANALAPAAAPSGGAAGVSASVGGENLLAYEIDRLFRTLKPVSAADMEYSRAEASRILLTTSGHNGVSQDDRVYLTDLVAERTGATDDEAATRVDQAIARADDALSKARRMAVLSAFMTAAALLLGGAVAWFAAGAGGHDRERDVLPWWAVPRRRVLA